jgi:hypothetical protein
MVKKSIVHGKGSNGKPQLPIPALPAVEDSASLSSPTDALAATTLAANGHHPKATASPAGAVLHLVPSIMKYRPLSS